MIEDLKKKFLNRKLLFLKDPISNLSNSLFLSTFSDKDFKTLFRIYHTKPELLSLLYSFISSGDIIDNIETLNMIIKNKLKKLSLRDTVNEIITETKLPRRVIYNEAIKIRNNK